jgi:predicted nucleic acid-binding protein
LIYVDSSVALAYLLSEDQSPPESFWDEPLVASRLLQYEVWNRLHARKLASVHRRNALEILDAVYLIELAPPILAHALEPFPIPVRTLDALHLASMLHLRTIGIAIDLASYDLRLLRAAEALGISSAL